MRLFIFSIALIFASCISISAQEFVRVDTVYIYKTVESTKRGEPKISEVEPSKYDKRKHRYHEGWQKLIPTHSKLQFAGNMGFASLGFGWDYGRKRQWETDVLFGYLPKFDSKRSKLTFTLKLNYIPWSLAINDKFDFEPLTTGMYFNTVVGDEFWVKEPDKYPRGYYGFQSKVRINIFVGERFTINLKPESAFFAQAITFFYEISTCDFYLISAFTNSSLRPNDYLSLSFGMKFQLL